MSKIKIVDCSTGCLEYMPDELQKRYKDIGIIPVGVRFMGEEMWEGHDFDPAPFYERLKTTKREDIPKTIPASPQMVEDYFLKLKKEGYDEILVITISSGLSGLGNTCRLVGDNLKDQIKVTVFDTRCVCVNELYMAVHAYEAVKLGKGVEEIVKELEEMRSTQEFMAVEGTLDFLIYNGRLKGAKAMMGKAFKICPIVGFSSVDGMLRPVKSVRTQRKSMDAMWEIYNQKVAGLKPEEFVSWIIYTAPDMLEEGQKLAAARGIPPLKEYVMSPSSGCHNGPYFIGFGFIKLLPGAKKYIE